MAGLELSIGSNIDAMIKDLSKMKNIDQPKAVGFAMNDAARKSSKLMNMNTKRVFNKPVAFTSKGFGYTKSRSFQREVSDKEAWVGVKGETHIKGSGANDALNRRKTYMRLETYGGERTPSKRYLVTPAKHSKLNQSGNFPKTFMKTVIGNKQKYFTGVPRGGDQSNKFNGVWQRYGPKGNQRIRMVAKFTERQTFRPLFPFDKLRNTFGNKIFAKELERQIGLQLTSKGYSPKVKF
tara:strand:- start:86 stop:796 length:711 start_codon:yes stop_codon:yes gene_type:complete